MSKLHTVEFAGQLFTVDDRRAFVFNRLQAAALEVLNGNSHAMGLVEVDPEGQFRGSYFVHSSLASDALLDAWPKFHRSLLKHVLLGEGNAPANNRSVAVQ